MSKTLNVVPIQEKRQADIVKCLEDFLDLAKKGEIVGFAIVGLYAPTIGLGSRAAWHTPANGYYHLLGAIEDMKMDLLMSVREFTPSDAA